MTETAPVEDWATDYDIFDPDYVRDPAPVWDELRGRCPGAADMGPTRRPLRRSLHPPAAELAAAAAGPTASSN